ncbi:unnamed protein product [Acanthosepion pharaonis]|uniref:tRNA-queuosine alpha-mannosyltransferase n=1 Tax=Acanthosepion pharaonis TaxID=158019 RepID=A0A812DAD4_ACAPH|nr:unnamed protein product [Sepia pharaonis]
MAEEQSLCTYLLIEPFCGGSHKQLIDQLIQDIPDCSSFTLPGKKWHWRARTSSVYFSQIIPKNNGNCNLVADTLVFNSQYNKNSFLENISTFLKLIPDYRPRNLAEKLAPKCKVVHFPLSLPPLHVNSSAFCKTMPGEQVEISDENLLTDKENSCLANSLATDYLASLQVDNYPSSTQKRSLDEGCLSGLVSKCSKLSNADQEDGNLQEKAEEKNENNDNIPSVPPSIEPESKPLHIVWPHRWEHDKDPDTLFEVLLKLHEDGLEFFVSVIGQTFTDVPSVFAESQTNLLSHIKNWGYVEKIFPGCYLYNTSNQLYKRLKEFCKRPFLPRNHHPQVDLEQFTWKHLKQSYCDILNGI